MGSLQVVTPLLGPKGRFPIVEATIRGVPGYRVFKHAHHNMREFFEDKFRRFTDQTALVYGHLLETPFFHPGP